MISKRIGASRRVVAGMLLFMSALVGVASAQTGPVVDFVDVDGVIDPVSSRFLVRQISQAEKAGAHAVIVRLNTPGGLDISMRQMVDEILNASVPVIVWVGPQGSRAASAGVFVTYAAHVAAMAPATNIGAAHPVDLGGGGDEVSAEKAANDAASFLVSIAKRRGRNVDFARETVLQSRSLDSQSALEQDVVDILALNPRELLDKLDGRVVEVAGSRAVTLRTADASLRFHEMSLLERILHSVVRPEIAYMLLLLGFYGILFELYNPGIGAAGVLGGIGLILGFYALSVLPTSWAGLALLALGVIFFVVDMHVAGLGVFTIGGTLAFVAGSLLLFSGASPSLRLSPWMIAGAVAATLIFFISVMTAALKARTARPVTGSESMVGTIGTARTDIAPEGQVMARGTLWRARTVAAAIPQGAPVKILGVSGLVLIVEESDRPAGSGVNGDR